MGKVLKRVELTTEAYRLAVPAIAEEPFVDVLPEDELLTPQASEAFAGAYDMQIFEAAPIPEPVEPQIDLEAVRAEASELIERGRLEAEALLEDAKSRALALVKDARERIVAMEAEARERGFAQGEHDGRAATSAQMDEMVQTMHGLVEMARAERHKIIESAEPELVKLALAIAERVVHQHIAVSPDAVVDMTRNALQRLVARESVTVRVNPHDIEALRAHRERILESHDIEQLRVIEDQRVDRGGVVIDTESGTIDARIGTQLREARRVLHVEEPMTLQPASEAQAG